VLRPNLSKHAPFAADSNVRLGMNSSVRADQARPRINSATKQHG